MMLILLTEFDKPILSSNEIAEVMMKTDKDVFIRLCTIYENEDGVFEDYDMIHVVLF